jgi:1-acyl-sn-glycerol-3-phosphate acyltransferase
VPAAHAEAIYAARTMTLRERLLGAMDRAVSPEVAERVDRVARHVNGLGFDKWGYSPASAKRTMVLTEALYRKYFRVEVHDIDRVPPGRGLLIGNHSSQLAYDGMMVAAAMLLDANPPRAVRAMIEKFFQRQPFVNVFMTRAGQLTGLPQHAERLLADDELVLVFPEGARGGGKVWRDRYKLMEFGSGFVRLALKTGSPITPFGFIGGEEVCPALVNVKPLARALGFPYFPITPTLLPLPLPARCSIWFGEPIRFSGTGGEDDVEIERMVARVRDRVRELLDRGLATRRTVF